MNKIRKQLPGEWHYEITSHEMKPCDSDARYYARLWGEPYD